MTHLSELLSADSGIEPDLEVSAAMLLGGVAVAGGYHKIINYNRLATSSNSIGVLVYGREILLIVPVIPLNSFRKRPEIGERIRSTAKIVGSNPGAVAIVHDVLSFSL